MSSIDKLFDIFKKFPTVGPRTASRFVYYLIKLPKPAIDELAAALQELKSRVRLCRLCFNPFELEGDETLCAICKNPSRDKSLLCIVEKEADLSSIENTKKYNGLYFVLGGTVAVLRKDDVNNLRIKELAARVKESNFSEVIIALNPTPEGRATSVLVEQTIKETIPSPAFKITHLARGIPVGGELEYADEETLESAFEGRK